MQPGNAFNWFEIAVNDFNGAEDDSCFAANGLKIFLRMPFSSISFITIAVCYLC